MVALTFVLLAAGPATAGAAADCTILDEPQARAECSARATAREAARAEVASRTADDSPPAAGSSSKRWNDAMEEAKGVDLGDVIDPRPLAALVGGTWFFLVARSRWKSRRRTRRA
ncbi:MAG: hypothetical protein JWM25_828 [Thermoleophilia bacterium]|nr:hypothetical protein [Thermoleophilia bacterium]MCZ4496245.1 hypothetical protein [Thermoleophilia bacterium]